MIDFINKTISGLFGKKSDRDIKSIEPIVAKIHESYKLIEQLSNDELRNKSNELKLKIAAAVEAEESKVKELKAKVETDEIVSVEEKEKVYAEIDALNKTITNGIFNLFKQLCNISRVFIRKKLLKPFFNFTN
jgi:preprotein translocase subunit SecA